MKKIINICNDFVIEVYESIITGINVLKNGAKILYGKIKLFFSTL